MVLTFFFFFFCICNLSLRGELDMVHWSCFCMKQSLQIYENTNAFDDGLCLYPKYIHAWRREFKPTEKKGKVIILLDVKNAIALHGPANRCNFDETYVCKY